MAATHNGSASRVLARAIDPDQGRYADPALIGRLCEAVEGLRDDLTEVRQWCAGVDTRLRAVEVAQGGSTAVRSLVRWAGNVLSPLAAAGLTILGMHFLNMHGAL